MTRSTRSKSSGRWLKEHFQDPFVKKAQQEGYRSRAIYKLMELQKRDKLFHTGMTVVDLGAAPGGWSQYASECVGEAGKVIASDILEMPSLPHVTFIQGDFREPEIIQLLIETVGVKGADIVISDMAPNISGMPSVDQPRMINLAELVLEVAHEVLKSEGNLLLKIFQGSGFDVFLQNLRREFKQVVIRKPEASRSRSAEVYLLAKGFREKN